MAKGQVVEGQYLKIYKATSALLVQIIGLVVFIFLIQWFKGWLFGWLFELTGWSFMNTVAQGDILLGIMLFLLVFWSLYKWLKWRSHYYEIYPDRIVIKKGIIARRQVEIQMEEFGALQIDQGIIGRLFNYGNLRFNVGSLGRVGRTLHQIPNPEYYLQLINSMLQHAPNPATQAAQQPSKAAAAPLPDINSTTTVKPQETDAIEGQVEIGS